MSNIRLVTTNPPKTLINETNAAVAAKACNKKKIR
jgi:hypothetical protein